jgi:hypothetical protein
MPHYAIRFRKAIYHEAVARVEAEDEEQAWGIAHEFERNYGEGLEFTDADAYSLDEVEALAVEED